MVMDTMSKVKFVLSYDEWEQLTIDKQKTILSILSKSKIIPLQIIYKGILDMKKNEVDVSFFHYYGDPESNENL
jgi:hypothetical protein